MKPNRSILSVPGHIEKMHRKAVQSNADVIMLDLEDSVPENLKEEARQTVLQSINNIDWGEKKLTLRINGTDREHAYRDILILEHTGDLVKSVVIPKVNEAGDIHFLSKMLDGIELCRRSSQRATIEAIIESARGLENIREIASASDRMFSLIFGIADYSESIGAKLVSLSGHGENEEELYPGHRWHYQLSKIVETAKARGLLAIDVSYGNFKDEEGLLKSTRIDSALGIDGKWAIHPDQVDTINRVFSPSPEEIEMAKAIIKAKQGAEAKGLGAVAIDGRMVDGATMNLAKKNWALALKLGLASHEDL